MSTLIQPVPPQRASSAQTHRQLLNPDPARSSSHPSLTRQQEKSFIVKNYDVAVGRAAPPPETAESPSHKQLGFSSRKVQLEDFELMRTLGTGLSHRRLTCDVSEESCYSLLLFSGTFARVWLARFANPAPEDRNMIFALKVLKKVDGMHAIQALSSVQTLADHCPQSSNSNK